MEIYHFYNYATNSNPISCPSSILIQVLFKIIDCN